MVLGGGPEMDVYIDQVNQKTNGVGSIQKLKKTGMGHGGTPKQIFLKRYRKNLRGLLDTMSCLCPHSFIL